MIQLESVSNTGNGATTGISSLSQLFVVVFAITVSLALPALALAQQSAKPKQETQSVISDAGTDNDAIRPFRVHVPEKEITDLRRRIGETRWPGKETVTDQSQGVQTETMRELVSN